MNQRSALVSAITKLHENNDHAHWRADKNRRGNGRLGLGNFPIRSVAGTSYRNTATPRNRSVWVERTSRVGIARFISNGINTARSGGMPYSLGRPTKCRCFTGFR